MNLIIDKWSQIPKCMDCMIAFIHTEKQAKYTDGDRCQEDDYHGGGQGAWGILVMPYILFLMKKKNGSFNHVKTQQTVHISIYISLCIPQEKILRHLSENKMI